QSKASCRFESYLRSHLFSSTYAPGPSQNRHFVGASTIPRAANALIYDRLLAWQKVFGRVFLPPVTTTVSLSLCTGLVECLPGILIRTPTFQIAAKLSSAPLESKGRPPCFRLPSLLARSPPVTSSSS